jgi:hypothetical protein
MRQKSCRRRGWRKAQADPRHYLAEPVSDVVGQDL